MAVCLHCGAEFTPNKIGQKFCCKEHRWRFNASESYKREKGYVVRDYRKNVNDDTTEQRYKQIADYRRSGMSYEEIAERLGYKVVSIKGICSKLGLIQEEKDNIAEECRKYKAQGHTMKEVAEHFNIKENTAQRLCKGIAPQKPDYIASRQKININTLTEREEKAKETINANCAGFEYAGGFTTTDGMVKLRCLKCGCVEEHSFVSIRHGNKTECRCCLEREKISRQEARKKERAKKEEGAKRIAEQKRRDKEAERLLNTIVAICPVCGKTFSTTKSKQVCCSSECSKRRQYKRKDKRIKEDKRVDKGINAKTLYQKDKGICWICGGKCNLKDYKKVNGTIICGGDYPSVDHIVPVCEGGEDAWSNVRLAHRRCNTLRYAHRFKSPHCSQSAQALQSGL